MHGAVSGKSAAVRAGAGAGLENEPSFEEMHVVEMEGAFKGNLVVPLGTSALL